MHPDELRQAIEQPAAKHGVVFEKGLVEQIIKEVEGQKGCLPLLQYTLNLLWQSECRTIGADGRPEIEDRTLNKTTYAALEGIRGALQKQVNEIYQNLNQEEQSATKQIFVKLVNIVDSDSGSKTVSRRANRSEFVGESVKNTLLTFIDENLLVSSSEDLSAEKLQVSHSKNSKQSATVEIAHEILLASWDRLKSWIEEEKEAIILKNYLADETRRWQRLKEVQGESKARDELLKGARLEQIVVLRDANAFNKLGGLSPDENKFVNTSIEWRDEQERQKKNRRRNTILSLSGSSVIAMILAIWGWTGRIHAKREAEEAYRNQLAAEFHSGQSNLNLEIASRLVKYYTGNVGDSVLEGLNGSESWNVEYGTYSNEPPGGNSEKKIKEINEQIKKDCPNAQLLTDCPKWEKKLFPDSN